MRERVLRALAALVGLAVFVAALEVLRRELDAVTWRTLSADVLRLSPAALALAILLTVANYLVLTGYDFIALAYVRRRIRWTRVVAASFLAYAVSNNVGFAMLSGTTVRYRFYTRWGVTADELSRIVLSYSITFWSGLLVLGGGSLAFGPVANDLHLPGARLLGWGFMGLAAAYVAAAAVRRTPVRIGRFLIPLPAFRLAVAQVIVSALDWALAGSVLYVLLPPGLAPPTVVLAAFLAAQLLGLASNVPGGVGVFEGLMVLMLAPYASSADVLPALLVYRVVYYLLPLGVALVGLVSDELHVRRSQAARAGAALGRLAELLAPHVLAVFIFLGGVVLLFSGSTPAAAGRLARLGRIVPLGVVETSHFVGSLVGALLLLLSQAVGRRLDAAFYLTSGALAVGIVASLLTGTGYGAALLLGALLLVVLRARPAFDRRAALFATRFSWSWVAAVIAALASSIWLGLFAFKNVAVFQRAVVAVRAARRGVPVPPGLGRGGDRGPALRAGSPLPPRAARDRAPHRPRSGGRGPRDRAADLDDAVPRVSA